MGSRLGWDEKRRDEEVARYVEAVAAAEAVLAESGDGGSVTDAGNARI